MPLLRCKRSLDGEMAATKTRSPAKLTQSPRKRATKRKLGENAADSPAKRLRHHSSPTKSTVGTKSFYGNKKSSYIVPEQRKALRENSSDGGLKPVDLYNISSSDENTKKDNALNKGKKQSTSTRKKNTAKSVSVKPKVESEFLNRYGKAKARNSPSQSSSQKSSENQDDAESTGTTETDKPAKKFFRNRSSPGEKAKATKPQVILRKGFKVSYKKSKPTSKAASANTSLETNQSSINTPKRRELNSSLLASLSTIKQLQTDCSQDALRDDDDERVVKDDNESLLTSICDEIEADNLDDVSIDSACHTGDASTVPTEQRSETTIDQSESPTSAAADSVMLLSEMSSEVNSTGMSTPQGSPAKNKKLFSIFRSSPRLKNKQSSVTSSPSASLPSTPGSVGKGSLGAQRSLGTRGSSRGHLLKSLRDKDGREQMILDFGQRLGGPIQCEVCGMTYTEGEPSDETTHSKFHQTIISALKFSGWKKERVCQENQDGSRIIVVTADDKFAKKKVEGIRQIVDNELGFVVERRKLTAEMKTFLYISQDKKVVGCCIAEGIKKGYRMVGDGAVSDESSSSAPDQTWCCSTTPEGARCGISRIWVMAAERRRSVATSLMDCVRYNFLMGYPLKKTDLAFSDPTPAGRQFATKYTGSSRFLVYNHNKDRNSQ